MAKSDFNWKSMDAEQMAALKAMGQPGGFDASSMNVDKVAALRAIGLSIFDVLEGESDEAVADFKSYQERLATANGQVRLKSYDEPWFAEFLEPEFKQAPGSAPAEDLGGSQLTGGSTIVDRVGDVLDEIYQRHPDETMALLQSKLAEWGGASVELQAGRESWPNDWRNQPFAAALEQWLDSQGYKKPAIARKSDGSEYDVGWLSELIEGSASAGPPRTTTKEAKIASLRDGVAKLERDLDTAETNLKEINPKFNPFAWMDDFVEGN
jgi:hypothetical protein